VGADVRAVQAIDVRDLWLAYGDAGRRPDAQRLPALRGVDLPIRAGEALALVGPNGAGKSTLLRCMTGLLRPGRGSVALEGIPVQQLTRSSIARRVAVVPQQVDLPFAMRVEEVVALGRIP